MAFRVPSSTPPSTPDSRRSSRNIPSTTPAGIPPSRSFIPSSTPAGPPPSSIFGSSHFNAGNTGPLRKPNFQKSAFGSSPPKSSPFPAGSRFAVPSSSTNSTNRGRTGFPAPQSSPPQPYASDEDEEEDDEMEEVDEEEEEEGDEEDEDRMEEDEEGSGEEEDEEDDFQTKNRTGRQNTFSVSTASRGFGLKDSALFGSSRGLRDSRNELTQPSSSPALVRRAAKQSKYDLSGLAKGLTPNTDRTNLQESDELILETERLMGKLQDSTLSDTPGRRTEVLSQVAQGLNQLWRTSTQPSSDANFSASTRSAGAAPISNAARLTNLLLHIHYPGQTSRHGRASAFSAVSSRALDTRQITPIPKVLLDWMNTYHLNSSEVGLVLREQRGYSAHPAYWEAVKYSVSRGNFSATLKLLKGGRFEVAETAAADNVGDYGYTGDHLVHVNAAVNDAINLIQSCPAVESDNWDVKGSEWDVFRRRVTQTMSDLKDFAERDSSGRNNMSQPFENFGMSRSQNNLQLSIASRKAESKVPWTVYENLIMLYKQLLGEEEEILATALDWVEAVIGLTIWWNGDDEETPQDSLAASRRSMSRSHRARSVDLTPVSAYCQRLSSALAAVVDDEEQDLSVNTADASEVALACIFEHNMDGFLQIIRAWSPLISSAVAEVASSGDWLKKPEGLMDNFDQSDLMVLSYNEERRNEISKDALLITYSNLLSRKEIVQSSDKKTTREGWELAVQVLGRLDDENTANDRIEKLLNDLPLNSAQRVDKILALCNSLGLSGHSSVIATKYADHLSKNTENYGDTLIYYARAHNSDKIQEVLHILASHCLVKSISYPPISKLDNRLNSLITSPKQTLTQLSRVDLEAAQILSTYLSGYATIRKFYDLRDEELLTPAGQKPSHRPIARRRAAAAALMVIISSAASSIRGGLYDPSVETVVKVDGLLSLLGEALIFVNQPKRTFTLAHLYALLAAVEDLETSPSLIYAQCEECFFSTLAAAHGDDVPSPRATLHKSTSNLTTASSQFSMVGSSMFASGSGGEGQSTESSAVLIRGGNVDDTKRVWDWRKGFRKDAKGEDVIRILRLGIAEEIGRAWVEGEG